jgi:hypothetical protein
MWCPAGPKARSIGVRVSPGELIERIVVLEGELDRASHEPARRGARADLACHTALRDGSFKLTPELHGLATEQKGAIEAALTAEDRVRECERTGDFGPQFVAQRRQGSWPPPPIGGRRCGGKSMRWSWETAGTPRWASRPVNRSPENKALRSGPLSSGPRRSAGLLHGQEGVDSSSRGAAPTP